MTKDALLSPAELAELRLQAEQLRSSEGSAQILNSRDAGWIPSSAIGSGMDYSESRPYQQGDDPRNINWRLSARSTETYVKTYHMEARPQLCIILDQRRPMIFGTRTRLKITQAQRLATLLIITAERYRINVNIILLGKTERYLETSSLEHFLAESNTLEQSSEDNKQASLKTCLMDSTQRLAKGSLLYVISDLADLHAEHQKLLSQLQEHCFVQALHVVDPAEEKLPKSGGVYLKDMVSKATFSLKAAENDSHDALNKTITAHQESLKQICIRSAVRYVKVNSHEEQIFQHIILPLGLN